MSIESLQAEIREVELAIEQKKETLREKETIAELALKQRDAEANEFNTVKEKHSEAEKELQALAKEKAELMPSFERAKANREQRGRAEVYKRDIATYEQQLKQSEDRIQAQEVVLQDVSSRYKEEREARADLSRRLTSASEALRKSIEEKITKTIVVEDKGNVPNPFDALDRAGHCNNEREIEFHNNFRRVRELTAITELKRCREAELEAEAARQIAEFRDQKDKVIKEMVVEYQREREALLDDIGELKVVNKAQAYNLQVGHVLKRSDPSKFRSEAPATKPLGPKTTRQSTFRKEAGASRELVMLKSKNEELDSLRVTLVENIRDLSSQRGELVKSTRIVKERLRREEENWRNINQQLEVQAEVEVTKTQELEKENCRLTEAVEQLAATLHSQKEQFDHVKRLSQSPHAIE